MGILIESNNPYYFQLYYTFKLLLTFILLFPLELTFSSQDGLFEDFEVFKLDIQSVPEAVIISLPSRDLQLLANTKIEK